MQKPNTYILQVGGIPVEVERKAVHRINLRVRPDGSVHMSVPWRTGRTGAEAFLRDHAGWLMKARERVLEGHKAPKEPGPGDLVALWGRLVPLPEGRDLPDLYKEELERALPAVVERVEAASGLHATRWQLRDMTSRWGSCTTTTGAIRINIRLAAYRPLCLEYVVAHELAHLRVANHGQAFHELVASFFPYEREARRLLRQPPAA